MAKVCVAAATDATLATAAAGADATAAHVAAAAEAALAATAAGTVGLGMGSFPTLLSQPLPPGLLRYDGAPSVPLSPNDSVTAYFTLVTTIATQVCCRCSGVLRSRHFT
jgi:hypothetical protein